MSHHAPGSPPATYLGAAARDVHCRRVAEHHLIRLLRLEGVGAGLSLCLLLFRELCQQ